MPAERLQKILASAGIASRRKSEELITGGRVSVNGSTVTELGSKADPRMDEIRVDGELLRGPERHVYIALYKPKGHVTTVSDPEGRPTVMDLLKGVRERVFPVGRLDYMSEGLLLLTNDGALMAQLTSPASHLPKVYMVKVSGQPSAEGIQRLRDGIVLPPEPGLAGARGRKQPGVERRSFRVRTLPTRVHLEKDQENPWYSVTLTEGRNRQIRRMFEQIGHHVEKIKRVKYGSLELDLEPGQSRLLTTREVNQLRTAINKPFSPRDEIRPASSSERDEKPPRRTAFRPKERRPPRRESRADRPPRRDFAAGGPSGAPRGTRPPRDGQQEFRGWRENRGAGRGERPTKQEFRGPRPARRDFASASKPGAPRGLRPPRDGQPKFQGPRKDREASRGERPAQREFRGSRPPRRDFAPASKPGAPRGPRPPRDGQPEFRGPREDRGAGRTERPAQREFRGPHPPRRDFAAAPKPSAPRGPRAGRHALGGRSGAPGQRRKGFRGISSNRAGRPRRPQGR